MNYRFHCNNIDSEGIRCRSESGCITGMEIKDLYFWEFVCDECEEKTLYFDIKLSRIDIKSSDH